MTPNTIREKKTAKLDKDRIFTSKWNPRSDSEAIYSSKSGPTSNPKCSSEIDTRSHE